MVSCYLFSNVFLLHLHQILGVVVIFGEFEEFEHLIFLCV